MQSDLGFFKLTCVKLCAVVYTVAFESYLSLTKVPL